jgi:hypothetical protein
MIVTPEESAALNAAIVEICDDESLPRPLGMSGGKRIPYIGWYWRNVDFTQPFSLGRTRIEASVFEQIHGLRGHHGPGWAGFMENNKWDYPEWTVTEPQAVAIVQALREAVKQPDRARLQTVFDLIQVTMPDNVRDWDGSTGSDDIRVG